MRPYHAVHGVLRSKERPGCLLSRQSLPCCERLNESRCWLELVRGSGIRHVRIGVEEDLTQLRFPRYQTRVARCFDRRPNQRSRIQQPSVQQLGRCAAQLVGDHEIEMTEKRVVAILKLQKIKKSNVEVEEIVEELKLACKRTGGILPGAGLNLEILEQAHVDMPPSLLGPQ